MNNGSQTSNKIFSFVKRTVTDANFLVIVLIIAYAVFFSYFTILKHDAFQTSAYDLGIYMQSLWNTLNGNGLFYTTLWEGSRFAAHFEPILFFILPIYAAFPKAETLLILQSVILALGALPVYWLARDELGKRAGVVFAAAYLLYPALHGVNSFDFHGSALAIPILLFCFYAFKKGRYLLCVFLAILAMMCKENVSLVIFTMGLYWLWEARRKSTLHLENKWLPREPEVRYSLLLTCMGLVWFVLAVFVIIPAFSPSGEFAFMGKYSLSLDILFFNEGTKLLYLVSFLAPLLFASLLHPVSLIGLPILAQNMFTDYKYMYSIYNQHPSLLIPWVFIAGIYGTKWLISIRTKVEQSVLKKFLLLIFITTIIFTLLLSPSPISLDKEMPVAIRHHKILEQVIELIPKEAFVFTQNDIFPHLCQRENAYSVLVEYGKLEFFEYYLFPVSIEGEEHQWKHNGNYDYILADSTTLQSIFEWADQTSLDRIESEYGIYAQGDGIILYRLGYTGEPITFE